MYEMGGHLLCLDCYERVQHLAFQELEQLAAAYNLAAADMEFISGVPMSIPRMRIPQRPVHYNPVNINIDRSVVGAVNTGQIHQLDVAVTHFAQSGNTELSKALQELTQAVVSDHEMEKAVRDQILEQLSFLVAQAGARPEQKIFSVAKVVIQSLSKIISTVPSLITLWEKLRLLLETAFS